MMASVCAVIVNVLSAMFQSKHSHFRAIPPSEFVPKWGEGEDSEELEGFSGKAQTVEEQKALLILLAKDFGVMPKRREVKK
jgi:hypothetical protein